MKNCEVQRLVSQSILIHNCNLDEVPWQFDSKCLDNITGTQEIYNSCTSNFRSNKSAGVIGEVVEMSPLTNTNVILIELQGCSNRIQLGFLYARADNYTESNRG